MFSKKKLFNLIELIVQALLLVSTFAIQSIEIVSHSYNSTTVTKTSFIGYTFTNGAALFFLIPIILMFINTILCLVSVFGNSTDKDGKSHIAIPISNLIYCFWILSDGNINNNYRLFCIVCLVLITIIAILKRTSFVVPKEEQRQQMINNIQETSNADELKKYKDLLDSGVITQEEFDAKKKQLLGL